jgi:hypothetical protein
LKSVAENPISFAFEATIQIAGIRSLEEATVLEALGVDLIGFPLRLNYHSPDITEGESQRSFESPL